MERPPLNDSEARAEIEDFKRENASAIVNIPEYEEPVDTTERLHELQENIRKNAQVDSADSHKDKEDLEPTQTTNNELIAAGTKHQSKGGENFKKVWGPIRGVFGSLFSWLWGGFKQSLSSAKIGGGGASKSSSSSPGGGHGGGHH